MKADTLHCVCRMLISLKQEIEVNFWFKMEVLEIPGIMEGVVEHVELFENS